MINVSIEPREIWAGKFPVRFNALNAAVKWHLQGPVQDIQSVEAENTPGFIRYIVTFDGVGDLGEVCIRELPDEQSAALIICAPEPPRTSKWTLEEESLIESQPDRKARRKVALELAGKTDAEREEILKWQEMFFNGFLQRLLSDSEIINALTSPSQHKTILLDLSQVFRGYDKISETSIDDKDIRLLNELNDAELRLRLTKLISGIDPVVLLREARKPHGSFEIADMELPIHIEGKDFYLCIPVKSGQEIRGKAKTVAVDWLYQILRPFLHFDRCVVVFISAKKCSQNLENEIKRARNKLGWNIQVIQGDELAKLLKLNSLLYPDAAN